MVKQSVILARVRSVYSLGAAIACLTRPNDSRQCSQSREQPHPIG